MALPRTPFASDPGYEKTSNFYPRGQPNDPSPNGRVRPEARSIAHSHTSGTVGLLFETMANPPQSRSRFKHEERKNFTKRNMRKIRQIQSESQRKQEEKSRVVQPVQLPDRYSHIPAKGSKPVSSHRVSPPAAAGGVKWGPVTHHGESVDDIRVPVNGTEVGQSRARPNSGHKESQRSKNFVAANISSSVVPSVKRPPSRQQLDDLQAKRQQELLDYQRGRVPQYLRARQDEWRRAEEERVASLPDPTIPPGHTLMTVKERLNTLRILTEHQTTLTAELNALPLTSVTMRVKQRKGVIEGKLSEIEDALKIFSRPRVFVKMDS